MTPRLPPAIGDGSIATPRIGTRSGRVWIRYQLGLQCTERASFWRGSPKSTACPLASPTRVGKRALMTYQLCPRQAVQARQPGAEQRAHLSRPGIARHRAQNRGPAADLRRAAVAGLPGAPPAPETARPQSRGRMHRQGQGPSTLRVRRQGVGRHHARPLERADSSSPTSRRCRAIRTTAIRWRP